MSKADDVIVEIDHEITVFGPELEGLQDFERLNIQPPTLDAVRSAIHQYQQRMGLLFTLRTAALAVIADGHPGIPIYEVKAAVLRDLQDQERTIAAALARFETNDAAGMNLSAGEPVQK